MNNFDWCRKNTYRRIGFDPKKIEDTSKVLTDIEGMVQRLNQIVSIAKPRLIMGGIRYGNNWEHKPLMDYMQEKFNAYLKTGNFEMLVDLFNFVVVEGELKTHPKHHFRAIDRKE